MAAKCLIQLGEKKVEVGWHSWVSSKRRGDLPKTYVNALNMLDLRKEYTIQYIIPVHVSHVSHYASGNQIYKAIQAAKKNKHQS